MKPQADINLKNNSLATQTIRETADRKTGPPHQKREIDIFTAHLAILDFIDNEMPRLGSVAELKVALVIWRKTHGWGKLTDSIGAAELAERTDTDAKAIRRALSGKRPGGKKNTPLTEKIGVVRKQELDADGDLGRTQYTWPVNERVRATAEKGAGKKAAAEDVGGVQVTPTPGVQVTPTGGGKIAPTQSEVKSESCTSNLVEQHTSDYLTTNRKTDDSPSGSSLFVAPESKISFSDPPHGRWTKADRSMMAKTLAAYMEGDEPPHHLVISTLDAGGRATALQIRELLDLKWQKGFRPGTKNGPRKWGWFPAVVKEHFDREHAQLAAGETAPKPSRDTVIPLDPAVQRGIEAIELPDSRRSIVESVMCSRCRDSIIQYTDGTFKNCHCSGDADKVNRKNWDSSTAVM